MPLEAAQCRTISIVLRVVELILGVICVGLVANLSTWTVSSSGITITMTLLNDTRILSFITCTSTYLTPSFLLLIATIHSDSFEHMRKAIFELVYNIFGAIVQGLNSIVLLAIIGGTPASGRAGGFYAAGVLGLFNAALYFVSFFISLKARQA